MTYVSLPDESERRVSFFLAMEEYVARRIDGDAFFMWRVAPSVVFGRNQLIDTEVNVDYCRANDIQMYRRKSGGGCIYADGGNVMLSYITGDSTGGVGFTFNRYTGLVVLALQRMGVDARASGRNDILVDGRKISGTAFYRTAGRSIVHGTMLYDTCMENMVGAITPSDTKLRSKGVESVRQRIALLKDHTSMSLPEVMERFRSTLCRRSITLTLEDVAEIERMEAEYLTDEFVFGRNPRATLVRKGRIEGVGDIELRIELKNHIIKAITLLGDFFVVGDIDRDIISPLLGKPLTAEAIAAALPEDLSHVVMGLTRDDLVGVMVDYT